MNCTHYGQTDTYGGLCFACWRERCLKAEAALKNQTEIAGKYEDRWLAEKQLREKAEDQLTHVLTSLEEGTLPWWQKKHDDLLAKWFKAEACAAHRKNIIHALAECIDDSRCSLSDADIALSVSDDCGEGWMSPEQVDAGVAGMKMAIAELRNERDALQSKLSAAVEALKLISDVKGFHETGSWQSCKVIAREALKQLEDK